MKKFLLPLALVLVAGVAVAQAANTKSASEKAPAKTTSAKAATKTHVVEGEVVSADATAKTITVKVSGEDKTVPVHGKAAARLASLKAGEKVALTCVDNAASVRFRHQGREGRRFDRGSLEDHREGDQEAQLQVSPPVPKPTGRSATRPAPRKCFQTRATSRRAATSAPPRSGGGGTGRVSTLSIAGPQRPARRSSLSRCAHGT